MADLPDARLTRDPSGSGDPVRWSRACEIFHAALEQPADTREAFVSAVCSGDSELHREVASLLASDCAAADFIDRPAATLLASSPATARAALAVGTTLGRYEILHFLGAGGLSEVYRCRDTRLGRTVALKLIANPHDPQAGARLLAEAQHASILNHPNICAVYEAEEGDGRPFIVLELVEGPTLHEVLKERRPSPAETVQWATQIADALEHAHRRGVIHRDLKSANVALTPDGRVKILDFGLSRRLADAPRTATTPTDILHSTSVAGTLTHIAPEVLRGEGLDERVDLWALGVMLYEMASGTLPFARATALETADAILETSPEALPARVPAGLRRVIERCLQKDPAARFGSAAELREALGTLTHRAGFSRTARGWVAVAATLVALLVLSVMRWLSSGTATAPVIAVLPLEEVPPQSPDSFFADGVTEGLVAELGRVDGIRVLAPITSRHSAGRAWSPREAARNAGATRLLEGSIARAGRDIHLRVRLVDASTGRVTWSDDYTRDGGEVQALQGAVAAAVARAADVGLNTVDARRFSAIRAVAPDVYEQYLKGRFYWNQRTASSIRTALTYFEAALALDPTYAEAYAAIADCYNQLATQMVGAGSPRELRPKAAAAANRALQIEPDLAGAHATLGYVHHYEWEWEDAEKAFRRSLALNPNNALAHIWYSNFLCSRKRFDEAIREVMIAHDLDPFSVIVQTNVGWTLQRARRTDEAVAAYEKALTLDPDYLQAHMRLAGAYGIAGRLDDAINESDVVVALSNRSPFSLLAADEMRMRSGRPNAFERRLADAVALPESYLPPGAIANFYFAARRNDEGLDWLERSFRERTNNMVYLGVESVFDGVRDHPRFKAMVQAIGLP